jgi:hypothetical protein
VDSLVPGNASDPGAIVVSESQSQIGILFGFLSLAFAAALARGVVDAESARIWTIELTIAGSGTGIVLGFFSRNSVREACLARGWRFDGQIGRGRA